MLYVPSSLLPAPCSLLPVSGTVFPAPCSTAAPRVTGSLVCPQLALVGSWSEFEALVQACLTNRTRKQGEMTVDYSVLQRV